MRRFSQAVGYRHQLVWMAERDKLEASFCRLGSGFVTANGIKEAEASIAKINQILTQYHLFLESGTGNLVLAPPPLPKSKDAKSVPKFVHSMDDGNLW